MRAMAVVARPFQSGAPACPRFFYYDRSFSRAMPASGASLIKLDRVSHMYSLQTAQLSMFFDLQH